MARLRFLALEHVQNRTKLPVTLPAAKISDFFGQSVFGLDKMRATLPPDTFKKVAEAIKEGTKIDESTADAVASAAKSWAMGHGVTHYTHWFQPLTGLTAEKHDSFFDASIGLEKFKGSTLVQQEPDASSFPHGGIRSTFEARGYTAWDPSSPMFIFENTLCIPTIFVSYTGEALDYKAPLLKAIERVGAAALDVVHYFDRNAKRVTANLGSEQEYFLIDKALFNARPDLVMSGRTVFGHNPARGQQLEDHYFGSISPRVFSFMRDFEIESLKLGIPVSTRHNEVAPGQFEVAPLFEELNLASDHNSLMIDVMNKVADRHNFKVLFHEKPFAGLNGSGKHCNWSLTTDTGVNLFQPKSSARENLLFLVFFVTTLKAVHEYNDLLRASIASDSNDYRLGANEAPPAIMSAFIGSTMSAVLNELEKNGNIQIEKGDNMYMKLGIDKIPPIILDNTDRNRTSPFAFTGNKFEFRAVGSSANVAGPMTVLNLIVADQLISFKSKVDALMDKGTDKKLAIVEVLRDFIKSSKTVRFEGDGYSEAWAQEAAKRGLNNRKNTVEAFKVFHEAKTMDLFERMNVMSKREVEARVEIQLEKYLKNVQIESRMIGDLAMNHIIPTATMYQNKLIDNAKGLKDLGLDNKAIIHTIEEVARHIHTITELVEEMIDARRRINKMEDTEERAAAYCYEVKEKYFEAIRYHVDKLELLVSDDDWPLAKYREMLFLR